MKLLNNLDEFVDKISATKNNPLDLSSDQDLSIAIMNLISIEEHLFFSGAKTHNNLFYDLIEDIRENRKELLKKIVKVHTGEVWCISKHLLASCMRLSEVATKTLHAGNKKEAYELFDKAYDLYCLFWGLNMDSLDTDTTKTLMEKIDPTTAARLKVVETEPETVPSPIVSASHLKNNPGFRQRLKNFVTQMVNCCRE